MFRERESVQRERERERERERDRDGKCVQREGNRETESVCNDRERVCGEIKGGECAWRE